ncbi:MAG TPA: LysM peptidoglycan-binding domain-containing protein [Tepidisphaeraceae bacterium]|nr:LysM peptidoglycan-binding domain-containing protein [Tepidisphaeraceae bacterium]
MRKDVRFGLTIGGILALVLVVWLALTDRTLQKQNQEVSVQNTPTTQPADDSVQAPTTEPSGPLVTTELPPATTQPAPVLSDWDKALSTGVAPPSSPSTQPIAALEALDNGDAMPAAITQPPAAQAAVSVSPRTHKVAEGESFYTIAQAVYGDSSLFTRIEDANPNIDARHLKIGMVLNIPDASGAVAAAPASAESSTPVPTLAVSSHTYKVQASDTLMRISRKLYGSSQQWQKIYDANRALIGDNPARLKVGMVLQLPQSPTIASARP